MTGRRGALARGRGRRTTGLAPRLLRHLTAALLPIEVSSGERVGEGVCKLWRAGRRAWSHGER